MIAEQCLHRFKASSALHPNREEAGGTQGVGRVPSWDS